MYNLGDTIAAVSSPAMEARVIVRISGGRAFGVVSLLTKSPKQIIRSGISNALLHIEPRLSIDAEVYYFPSPHSYTGEDVAELHFYANREVAENLMVAIFKLDVRQAEAGEFTARGFLNAKYDISQAEAVNQIITASNKFQVASAQRLLGGRLSQVSEHVRNELLDCLSLLEAGMDFSDQDIEVISPPQAAKRLRQAKKYLDDLLGGLVACEIASALPSVGIAGAPNAGKSSLFNAMLGKKRSIVSRIRKTTRDILAAELTLGLNHCVLFDCAGLIEKPSNIIDTLSQRAAIESLESCDLVVLCVDVSKSSKRLREDLRIRELIKPKAFLAVAAKADRLTKGQLKERIEYLEQVFGIRFLAVSSKTLRGINDLKARIDRQILDSYFGFSVDSRQLNALREFSAISGRHREQLKKTADAVKEALSSLREDNIPGAAMFIRSAVSELGQLDRPVDEDILDRIFSSFCIGK